MADDEAWRRRRADELAGAAGEHGKSPGLPSGDGIAPMRLRPPDLAAGHGPRDNANSGEAFSGAAGAERSGMGGAAAARPPLLPVRDRPAAAVPPRRSRAGLLTIRRTPSAILLAVMLVASLVLGWFIRDLAGTPDPTVLKANPGAAPAAAPPPAPLPPAPLPPVPAPPLPASRREVAIDRKPAEPERIAPSERLPAMRPAAPSARPRLVSPAADAPRAARDRWFPYARSVGLPGRGFKPSFDCSRAKARVNRLICADAGLAALDVEMSSAFRKATARADRGSAQRLGRDQTEFLNRRGRCAAAACVARVYRERIEALR